MSSSSGDGTTKIASVREFVDSMYQRSWFIAEREKEKKERRGAGAAFATPGASPPKKGINANGW